MSTSTTIRNTEQIIRLCCVLNRLKNKLYGFNAQSKFQIMSIQYRNYNCQLGQNKKIKHLTTQASNLYINTPKIFSGNKIMKIHHRCF